jgi:hypothetical protein
LHSLWRSRHGFTTSKPLPPSPSPSPRSHPSVPQHLKQLSPPPTSFEFRSFDLSSVYLRALRCSVRYLALVCICARARVCVCCVGCARLARSVNSVQRENAENAPLTTLPVLRARPAAPGPRSIRPRDFSERRGPPITALTL